MLPQATYSFFSNFANLMDVCFSAAVNLMVADGTRNG
jgi:hypothetical protein